MECLCGKAMTMVMEKKEGDMLGDHDVFTGMRLWACPPDGCGRLFLESLGGEDRDGTWYTAEQNGRRLPIWASNRHSSWGSSAR